MVVNLEINTFAVICKYPYFCLCLLRAGYRCRFIAVDIRILLCYPSFMRLQWSMFFYIELCSGSYLSTYHANYRYGYSCFCFTHVFYGSPWLVFHCNWCLVLFCIGLCSSSYSCSCIELCSGGYLGIHIFLQIAMVGISM